MRGRTQGALRQFTRLIRPLSMRTAGQVGAYASIVRHVGRRSGKGYETPVVVAEQGDDFVVALPYGRRTDWLHNVIASGSATLVREGEVHEVDRPEVVPIEEAATCFRPKEQRMYRRFGVETALRLHRAPRGG